MITATGDGRPDFRYAYRLEVERHVDMLRKLRTAGSTEYRLGKGTDRLNPSRMRDDAIERAAERQAARTIDMAINIHNLGKS